MFSGQEHTRIRSTRSFDDLLEAVKHSLKTIGRVRISGDGEFTIQTEQSSAFAWEVKIDGYIEPRKNPDEYTITIRHRFNPSVAGLILGVLFLVPVGIIFLFLGMNAQQELQRRINDALREIEDEIDEGK